MQLGSKLEKAKAMGLEQERYKEYLKSNFTYHFKARTRRGQMVSGTVTATSRQEAIQALVTEKMAVLELKEEKPKLKFSLSLSGSGPLFVNPWARPGREIAIFTRQLAIMYKAGIPIFRAVGIAHDQLQHPGLRYALACIYFDVLRGIPLSQALKNHPDLFSPQYIGMVKASEESGTSQKVLEQMADFLEKEYDLKQRVKAALTYPVVIFTIAIILNFFIFTTIVPQFIQIFENMRIALPPDTRFLLALGKIFSNAWAWLGFIVLIFLGFKFYQFLLKIPAFREGVDYAKLKLPIIGKIYQNYIFTQVFRTMGVMMEAGLQLDTILKSVAELPGNRILEKVFNRMTNGVMEGETLAQCFAKEGMIFPRMVHSLIMVGEESGEVDYILEHLSGIYEMQLSFLLNTLTTLLEPILLIGLGIMVGFMVTTLFVPLYGILGPLN